MALGVARGLRAAAARRGLPVVGLLFAIKSYSSTPQRAYGKSKKPITEGADSISAVKHHASRKVVAGRVAKQAEMSEVIVVDIHGRFSLPRQQTTN
jgi:hypothetical protein